MKALKLASLSGAVTASLALGAATGLIMPVAASAAQLTINGKACGTYQKAEFDNAGALTLTNVTGASGCEFGGGEIPVDPDPVDPDPVDPGPEPEEPGGNGIPSYCKNQNPAVNYTVNGYIQTPRQTAMLTGLNDYIAKLVPGEGRGYGTADNYATAGMQNTRTFAVSECPGDFTEHLPKQGVCVAQGQEYISLRWSYEESIPAGRSLCRLEAGKTYYFNVRNAAMSDLNKVNCASGTCSSYFDVKGTPSILN